MGAWGVGAFANDAALDWLAELDSEGPDLIKRALLAVADRPDDEVSMRQYSHSVAAAALVASAVAAKSVPLPPEAIAWLAQSGCQPGPELVDLARRAVQTILRESEMKGLWMESQHSEEWREYMTTLENSLHQT